MSLFDRISNLTKATLHEALNKLEDPVLMTGQYLRNLEEDLRVAEKLLREQRMNVSIQERKQQDALESARYSEAQALAALEAGDDVKARAAASGKIRHEELAEQYGEEASQARSRVVELEIRLEEGKQEYARLKEKRNELAARARKVDEQAKVQRPNFSYGLDTGAAARGFERMEEKILEWEAGSELRGASSPTGASAPADVADNSAVNDELKRLKEQLNNRSEG